MISKLGLVGALAFAAPVFAGPTVIPTVDSNGMLVTKVIGNGVGGNMVENPQSCGTVDFDTCNPNGGAYCCSGWTISDGYAGIQSIAQEWIAGTSGSACEVDVVVGHVTGPNNYTVTISSDAGGIPGSVLASANFVSSNSFGSTQNLDPITLSTSVTAGTTYWLTVAANGGGQTWGALNFNNAFSLGNQAYDPGSGWVPFNSDQGNWVVSVSAGGGSFTLTQVGGTCPGSVKFDSTNGTAGGTVGLVYANATGAFVIPGGPCAGTTLGLGSAGIMLVATKTADGSGTAHFGGNAPPATCGRFLQAVDASSCTTSNVAVIN